MYTINSFLHSTFQKYKKLEWMRKRSMKLGNRMAFLCWLIGRSKRLAYGARVRVAGRKLKAHVHKYVVRFRRRRKERFERQISQFLAAYTSLDKMIIAGRLILFMVVRIQRTWRRWVQQKEFMVFVNLLKWQRYEERLHRNFDLAKESFNQDIYLKLQNLRSG